MEIQVVPGTKTLRALKTEKWCNWNLGQLSGAYMSVTATYYYLASRPQT